LAILHATDGILLSGGEDGLVRAWEICPVDQQLVALEDGAVREDDGDLDSYIPPPSPANKNRDFDKDLAPTVKHGRRGSMSSSVFIKLAETKSHSAPVCSIAVLSDGKIISGSKDHVINIHTYSNQRIGGFLLLQQIKNAHGASILSLLPTSDGLIYSGSVDSHIKVWGWNDTKLESKKTLKYHSGHVYALSSIPGATPHIVSCSADKKVVVWDCKSGAVSHTVFNHTDPVLSVLALKDGRILAGTFNYLYLFELIKEKYVAVAYAHVPDAKQFWTGALLP